MTETKTMEKGGATELARRALPGKYLTFVLEKEVYGLNLLKVQEIVEMMNVTSVPRSPDFVRGVINLRGKVIPIMELRLKFGMEPAEDTERTCIIVVQVSHAGHEVTMGSIVDEVYEVVDISTEQIEPPPSFGNVGDTDFILGMGKVDDKVVLLLDVDKVLSSKDLDMTCQITEEE